MKTDKINRLVRDFLHGDMPEERMLALQELYLDNDIACYIGEDTPF